MKLFSSFAVAVGALLSLSVGCKDSVQPEPPAVVQRVTVYHYYGPVPALDVGHTLLFYARAHDQHGTLVYNQSFTWQSSNEAIATVSGGLVTAKALGTVTISATTAGMKGEMAVAVTEVPPPGPWDY